MITYFYQIIRSLCSISGIFIVMLWTAIGTGPWNISTSLDSAQAYFNAARAWLPIIVFFAGLIYIGISKLHKLKLPSPFIWLALFVITGIISTTDEFGYWGQVYWGIAYLAAIIVVLSYSSLHNPVLPSMQLNSATWAVGLVMFVILLYVGQAELFVQSKFGLTGYGIES